MLAKLAWVACSGLINEIFGLAVLVNASSRRGRAKRVTTKLTEEEQEDGTTVIRERERFVQELSVVFATVDGHA